MHCAFAKYEQGFKRKNEYLERRRVKRKEEIERGVQQELKKRGMTGELDDPLLMSSVPQGGSMMPRSFAVNQEESSLGMNLTGALGNEDSNLSLGKMNPSGNLNIDDSELSNNLVPVKMDKKPSTKERSHNKKSGKKDKKDKRRKSSRGGGLAGDSDTELRTDGASTLRINT